MPEALYNHRTMFTGIVQGKGRVAEIREQPLGVRFVVDRQNWNPPGIELSHGDSVCVSGVCLTLVNVSPTTLEFDVIAETLAKTKLGELSPGSEVNLESSLTPQQQMGGHFVQGHVEGMGMVRRVIASNEEWRLTIEAPEALRPCIVPKGSVAVDGVSMTVAAVSPTTFDIALIPTTLKLTTLGDAKVGERINIETDIVSRTIVFHLQRMLTAESRGDVPRVTRSLLQRAGLAVSGD